MYFQALATYYEVFFAEEEKRIRPFLQISLQQAQEMSANMPLDTLIAELSHGVHFELADHASRITLAPSYWANPLAFYGWPRTKESQNSAHLLILFGSRPASHDIIPGDTLPQDLVNMLKAVADPTRLRILRYLAEGPQNPAGLSRKLRLRAPTVIHHLNALRLAGMVEITLHEEGDRGYSLRREALDNALALLQAFLSPN